MCIISTNSRRRMLENGHTIKDVHDDAGDVIVRAATRILSCVCHLAAPHRQHADQHRHLRLLGDDETRLRIGHDQSSVLEPVDVGRSFVESSRVTDELDWTSSRHVLNASYLNCWSTTHYIDGCHSCLCSVPFYFFPSLLFYRILLIYEYLKENK